MRKLKYYISNILATMFAEPFSGLSKVWGFSQGQVDVSTDMVAGWVAAFDSLVFSEQNKVAASSIPTIILEVFSFFMVVCVSIKLLPSLAPGNRMIV